MYKIAIKNAVEYIRPLITGLVTYKNRNLIQDICTLIVLNKNGDILTTKKNANLLLEVSEINKTYQNIFKEMQGKKEKDIKKIEKKYGINDSTIIALSNVIVNTVESFTDINIIMHPTLDMAIISFKEKENVLVKQFPKFKISDNLIGTSICNVGFAFPEYQNFTYDDEEHLIKETNKHMNFPILPIDGIITRNMTDNVNNIPYFQTSAKIMPGMQGGITLDKEGNLLGMLSDLRIIKVGTITYETAIVINSKEIIDFLKTNKIEFDLV